MDHSTELSYINESKSLIESAKSPLEAATLGDNLKALRAALDASNTNKQIRDEAAIATILAERKLGALLLDLDIRTSNQYTDAPKLEELGINKSRSFTAQKLARIDIRDLEGYFERQKESERHITIKGALKLIPPKQRIPTSNLQQVYSAPPIDIERARRIFQGLGEDMIILMMKSLNDALQNMRNKKHAQIWLLKHGINPDGTFTEPLSSGQIGVRYGKSREYIDNEYHRAKGAIYEGLAVDGWRHVLSMLNRLQDEMHD